MPFDPEAGSSTANSFISVERADELLEFRLGATAWSDVAVTEPVKEAALVTATTRLSSLCYEGDKTASEQSLPFPRDGVETIPLWLEQATAEYALLLVQSYLEEEDLTTETDIQAQGIKRIKAGPVELEFSGTGEEGGYNGGIPASVRSLIPSSWLCVETVTATLAVYG